MRALLILILTLTLLSAANGFWKQARAGGRVEIEMSVWGMPFENALYTQHYIPQFERENPNIRVRFHHYESYPNRILMLRAGGIAPDVMRQNIEFGAQFVRRGMNLALDRYIDGPDGIERSDFIPATWEALRYRDQTFGVPQDINIRALYYNQELFDAAGLPYPTAEWTWKDLKHACDRLSDPKTNGGKRDIAGLVTGFRAIDWLPFYYQAGGRVWNPEKTRPEFSNSVAEESLRFFKEVVGGFSINQASSERGGLGPYTFFQNGRAAMLIDGSWRTPQLKKDAPDLRFGVAPLSRMREAMSVSTSCFWGVSAQTRHPDEAWKLVKFLSDKEQLIKYWQFLWVAPPARWSALRSPEFRRVTGAGPANPGLTGGEAEFREKCAWIPDTLERQATTTEFIGPFTRQLYDELSYAVEDVLLQGAEPGAALRQAQRELVDQIREVEKSFVQ